jgi:predicted extracellular nuclease
VRGRRSGEILVATQNMERLDRSAAEPPFATRLAKLSRQIREVLGAPDILAVQEVQDDTGPENDGTVSARRTLTRLAEAIEKAGGVRYEWRSLDPVDNADGGQPGANIRTVLLFNPTRVEFVDRDGCGPDGAAAVAPGPALSCSPGLVDPTNPAFAAGRKPLVGELRFMGRRLVVVNVHLVSKGGDDPIFGRRQPPQTGSTARRTEQAEAVTGFVGQVMAADPAAGVIVLGDFNDFESSEPLRVFETVGLEDLVLRVPAEQRYTFVYVGNSQVLDHVLVGGAPAADAEIDIVHVNADFPDSARASDHDPIVVRLALER